MTFTSRHPDVELRLPADGAYLSVLRTTTAGLAARLDFTLDDIEDLRIAVDEASAMVLPQADPGSSLTARFYLANDELVVEVRVSCIEPHPIDVDGFSWQVLNALTSEPSVVQPDGELGIVMCRRSGVVA